MTNDLLRKNAEVLKVASVEAAKESERGIVDLETLQNTNASLISTLDEVMQIQADGRMKRQAAEVELRKMEDVGVSRSPGSMLSEALLAFRGFEIGKAFMGLGAAKAAASTATAKATPGNTFAGGLSGW